MDSGSEFLSGSLYAMPVLGNKIEPKRNRFTDATSHRGKRADLIKPAVNGNDALSCANTCNVSESRGLAVALLSLYNNDVIDRTIQVEPGIVFEEFSLRFPPLQKKSRYVYVFFTGWSSSHKDMALT